jgi:uncharacterized OB-fold protein
MTADDALRLQRCTACSRLRWPPMPACPGCYSDAFEVVPSTGVGTLWTFTIAHRTLPAYQDEAPFAVGIVALDEASDVRLLGRIVDCPLEDLRVGMPLHVEPPAPGGDRFEFRPIAANR